MTDLLTQVRAWSMARQGLTQPAATPLDALNNVVGVYSSHPSAPLSLYIRSRTMSAADFRALEQPPPPAVRIPAMRGSIFLVPAAEAARIFAATTTWVEKRIRNLAPDAATMADYHRVTPLVLAAADTPRTAQQLQEAARQTTIEYTRLLRMLTYEGLLLRVGADSLRSDLLHYVETSTWLGAPLTISPDAEAASEGLAWLAGEYLRAFGPVRVADFAWWAGVPLGQARRAVATHATIDVGGGLLLHAADEAAFAHAKLPADSVVLLPKWDAYTMGYAPDGRARFVHADVQKRAYTEAGDGNPLLLVAGEAVGTWGLAKGAELKLDLFDTIGPKMQAAVEAQAAIVRALLDTP